MTHKRCRRCNTTKPVTSFGRHKARRDGLQSYCRACNNAHLVGLAVNREKEPLIDLTKPEPGSKVHTCGTALVFGTIDGHGYEWCGRCRTQTAFGR